MHIEFDHQDIEKLSNKIAEIVLEKLKDTQNTSLLDIDSLAEYLNVSKSWVYEKTNISEGVL